MKYINLGKTDIKVSRLCVGCMSYGKPSADFHLWTLEQPETEKMVKQAIDLGVNFFDTANCYAFGTSEEYLGKSLKHLGIKREDVVLASKVYFNEEYLSREAIHREIEGTLRRLGTDYLDLYQIHRFDYDHPIEETMEALDEIVKEGKVRAIGASAMYGYQFHNMQVFAEQNHLTPFSTMQNHYNLLYREDERELIPVCKQFGVSLIPYSPLAGGHLSHTGWLSGSKRSETDKTIRQKYDSSKENDLQIIDRVAQLAERLHVSMSVVALAWQYAKGVASPIVGATNPAHFSDACKAIDLQLSSDDVAFLEAPYRAHEIVGAQAANKALGKI